MSASSAQSDLGQSLGRVPALAARPSPALVALTDTLARLLSNLREGLSRRGLDHPEEPIVTADRHVRLIRGAFRLCGAHTLGSLCGLMLEVISTADDRASTSLCHALQSGCSALLASLPSFQKAHAVPAGWLLPAWRELAAQMPAPVPSPAAMISLGVTNESAASRVAQAGFSPFAAPATRHEIGVTELDTVLLDFLRAEPGSDTLRESLRKMGTIFAQLTQQRIEPHHGYQQPRLAWSVLLAYCALLATDAPMDMAIAKKNLSLVVREIRQSAQRSSLGSVNLPYSLLQEIVFQIAWFAPVNTFSQSVRDCFMLDWQLSPRSAEADILLPDEQKTELLARLEALESGWTLMDSKERIEHIKEIANAFRALSCGWTFELIAASLSALVTRDETHELPLVAGLVIARAAVEISGDAESEPPRSLLAQALETLATLASSDAGSGMAEKPWWDRLNRLPLRLTHSAAMAAARSALRSVFAQAEQTLGLMIESGDTTAVLHDMSLALDRARGALVIVGASAAVDRIGVLRQALCVVQQATAAADRGPSLNELQTLALQWVQLCDGIDLWTLADGHQRAHRPDPAASGLSGQSPDDSGDSGYVSNMANAGIAFMADPAARPPENVERTIDCIPDVCIADEASSHDRLEQIFIQEATQRLSRLRQDLAAWVADTAKPLPDSIACEAHGLAGSSGTVGRQRLHDAALALEGAVDYLASLPVASQHAHSDTLMQGVEALQREFQPEIQCEIQPTLESTHHLIVCADNGVASAVSDALHALWSLSRDRPDRVLSPAPTLKESSPRTIDGEACCDDTELLAVFSEEAAELLPLLAKQMGEWLATPTDESLRSGTLRLLHTLKGSARMAGQMLLGERLHRMEHEVTQLQKATHLQDPDQCALRQDLAQLFLDAGLSPEPLVQAYAAPPSSVCATPQPEPPWPARAAGKAVVTPPKLRHDLLERASGSAAELLVGAARTTEAVQRHRQTVSELTDNLARLRTQLRELELQSESRITAQAQPSASAFDPLEFDRYTRLQELARMTAESLSDLTSLQRALEREVDSVTAMMSQQTRHARELQSDLRRAGMQAFSCMELRLRHLVRQVAGETGREVHFALEGAHIEIDRQQLDRLSGVLQHLIRNAIVHGIELPEERERTGKPRCGLVRLALSQQGGELRLHISDDGRGLDLARIHARAIELGVLARDAVIDDSGITELIFHPGLSTADTVTGLAGRGIGMDAVKEAVMQMGGALKVDSLPGAGTCITLGLPQLLSTRQVLVVSMGRQAIAFPASLVQQLMQPSVAALHEAIQRGSIEWHDQVMPLRSLAELLGRESAATTRAPALASHRPSVVLLRQLDQWLAIIVNEVLGHREVVVKPTGEQLVGVAGLAGAALQADGSVLLIVNPLSWFERLAQAHGIAQIPEGGDEIFHKAPLVMVVDDSLTVRRVSQRLLERRGYRVVAARHGIEALEQLREITPAAMLLDIEMPRMDGFELLGRLRADERLKLIPIAMVTSRAAERHRSHAMQLGADAYFGKPYRDQELFDWLNSCAPISPAPSHAA